ncbi:CarD-like/TRCF domain protein [Faecalicatena acetigenes]|uniref:CarD-like/TRCF domain protein n=1 Tax=Faecalicatena acetigenes TaxID=2981790 RepID=A0ABT2T9G3_9FIRM|nr:CarD family transcriptional regulator [Faecalicatena acetigenes]MCU6746914.1 CarD-like/TRCF domain protein [Faecalicatena acetigenes]SCH50926.1 CarD-like/TRCF domain [uncultured Clostridium sp.]
MLKSGDAVVYKCRGVYKIEEIGTLNFSFADKKRKYYTLQSVDDSRDKAYVPMDDVSNIRQPVSKEEALALIGRLDEIEVLGIQNEKYREQEYKNCISGYRPESWVRVLKTLYKRTKSRGSMTSMDKKYQMLLEHALFSEFAFSLGIPKEDIPEFIQRQKDIKQEQSKK